MNKIYRTLWNCALGTWVAAPETARTAGKASAATIGTTADAVATASPVWRGSCQRTGAGLAWPPMSAGLKPTALALAAAAVAALALLGAPQVVWAQASVSSTGDVSPTTPTTPTWDLGSAELRVGNTGNGTLDIKDGGKVTSVIGYVGMDAGSTGQVTVSGNGSQWLAGNSRLDVGHSGNGTLDIKEGGKVTSGRSYVGSGTGSTGQVTVSGNGSQWSTGNSRLDVGNSGNGTLDIKEGGAVTSLGGAVGMGAASTGQVTVSGNGSQWSTGNSSLYVGGSGNGTLDIKVGGAVTSGESYVGFSSVSTGQVTVSGNGSQWSTGNSSLYVGNFGKGTLDIKEGGAVTSGASHVGRASGSTGQVTVSGNGSQWSIGTGSLWVGNSGNGSLDIKEGSVVLAASTYVAVEANSIGTVTVSGNVTSGRGVLETGQIIKFAGTGQLTLNGGVLRAKSSKANFISGFNMLTLGHGGGFFDTNGHDMGVSTALSGNGGLTKLGAGVLTLSSHTSSYQGGTTIAAGTLQVGNGGTPGTLSTGAVVNNAELVLNHSAAMTVANAISGSGKLTKQGAGTLNLSGHLSYSGDTHVNAGTLNLQGGGTPGSLPAAHTLGGNINVAAGAGLGIASSQTVNVAGAVTLGNGSTLSIESLPTGPSLSAASIDIGSGVSLNLSGIAASQELDRVLISTSGGIRGDMGQVSVGGVSGMVDYLTLNTRKSDDGKQYLASYGLSWFANTNKPADASGSFTLTSGAGRFDVRVALSDQAANPALSWDGISLTKSGAGALVLSAHNTYSGTTTINGGTLQIGNGAEQGSLGTGAVVNNANLVFNRSNTSIVANAISGTGNLSQQGTGTTVLTGNNSYSGTTTIAAGTLQVGDGGTLGTGAVVNNGVLSVNRSGAVTLAQNMAGTGALLQQGAGTTTLTGSNTFTGGAVVAGGTLRAGSAAALPQNAAYYLNQGATLDLNGHDLQASQLMGAGNIQLGAADLTISNTSGQSSSFGGQLEGIGHLVKQGAGTLALNNASSFSGGVNLKGGSIHLGNAQGLGTGTLAMDDGTRIALTAANMTIANRLHMTGSNDPIIDTGAYNGIWAGAITGAGFLTKQGSGALTFTSAGNSYTGATDVSQGTLQAGAMNTFSSASAHSVAAGAMLDLAGYSQTLSSLNNSGAVKLSSNSGGAPGAVLKMTGPYVGSGGTLGLSTVLNADGSRSDKLLLSGAGAVASGSTSVQITNAGGLGAQTTGSGIEVIATENGGSLQAGSFTLAGGHVDAGAYEYRLFQTDKGAALQSSLAQNGPQSAYRSEVPLMSAMPAQLRQADMAMLGDMRKRIGDEGVQRSSGLVSTDLGASRRIWGRVLRIEPTIRQQGTVSPDSRGRLSGFQTGLDLFASQSIKAGLYVGQLDGDMSVTGFASGISSKQVGFNSLRSRYFGVYGNWQDASGLYADAVLQGAQYRSTLHTSGDSSAAASTKGSGWMASLEVGKSYAINAQWQIEPQAQLIYRKLSIDDTAFSMASVKTQADDDWTLRLGARIKASFATSAGVLQPYGRVNVYKASRTTDVARFITPAATTDISAQGGYTATELAAGASLQMSARTSVYGELGKLLSHGSGSQVKSGVQASMGIKVLW